MKNHTYYFIFNLIYTSFAGSNYQPIQVYDLKNRNH